MDAADAQLKDAMIEAVVIRADGTREDLGVVARLEQPSLARRILNRLKGE